MRGCLGQHVAGERDGERPSRSALTHPRSTAGLVAVLLLPAGVSVARTDAPGRVTFVDEAPAAGVLLRNVSGGVEKRHILETTGAGACFLDYDLDGDLDLYLVNGATIQTLWRDNPARDALYRNDGPGRFTDVTVEAGVGDAGWGGGCATGDYDNDGDADLYVTNFGPNVLYRNEGGGRFSDATSTAGVAGAAWSLGAAFVDIERDGDLDLYVANYLRFRTNDPATGSTGCTWKGLQVMCGPRGFPGEEDVLYRNNGDGTFTAVSEQAGVAGAELYGMGVVAGDLDADGDTDIFVANDSQDNQLFTNDGQGHFTDKALWAGVALSGDGRQQASMGAALGDYDDDGDEDLFVTNFSDDYHTLYRNEGGGLFTDVTAAAGLAAATRSSLGWGTGFFDYDNDGDLDLFLAGGHVYPQVDGGDPATSYRQQNLLFRNEGNGTFIDVSNESGPGLLQVRSSRGVAFGDYDDDGDVDLAVINENDTPTLLRNDGGNEQAWVKVRLIGSEGNRDGIGARLRVLAGARTQFREVRLSSGYCSSHDPRVHIGLGGAGRVDRLEIQWPSGRTQTLLDLPAGRIVTVHEQRGIVEDFAPSRGVRPAPAASAEAPQGPGQPSRGLAAPAGGQLGALTLREIDGLVQAGSHAIMAGEYGRGVDLLEQAVRRLPEAGEAMKSPDALGFGDREGYRRYLASIYDNMGVGLMRAERFAECASAIGQAITLVPDRALFHQNLGLCHLHARRHGPAIAALRQARALGGAGESLPYDLGRALVSAGRCAEAVPELRLALDKLPANDPQTRRAECWYQIATCLAEQGRHQEATDGFRETLWLVPGHQRALYKLGLSRRAMDQNEAAERAQSIFRLRQPADEVVRSLKRAGPRSPSQRLQVARTFLEAGLPGEAFLEVERLLSMAAGDATAWVLLGQIHQALRAPDLSAAERAFRRSLDLAAGQADALAGLGETARRRGRLEEADRWFRQSLGIRADHVGGNLGLARLDLDSGRVAEAVARLERLRTRNAGEAHVSLALAWVHATAPDGPERRPEESLRLLDQIEALYGQEVETRVRALAGAGRTVEAERLIEESPFLGSAAREELVRMIKASSS